MKQLPILFIICILSSGKLYAFEKRYNIYETKPYDSVQSVARQFLPTHQREYGSHLEEYINDLKFWNTHVKNWNQIPEHTEIYVDYPYPPFPAPRLSEKKDKFIDSESVPSK